MKIARLSNDLESIKWLSYENGGYPRSQDGHITKEGCEIAARHGREYIDNNKKYIFTDMIGELEAKIISQNKAINNFSAQGVSVSGDLSAVAMNNFTNSITRATKDLLTMIAKDEKKIMILRNEYYNYALKKSIEISFGNIAESIFETYRSKVDLYLNSISSENILKLKAIEENINSDNVEMYSQALTSCRRLFEDVSNDLFNKCYPSFKGKIYKAKSGKEIDIGGDHYLNRLSAVVEFLDEKSTSKTLIESGIAYFIDWMENLNNLQCKGVHSNITREDACKCVIQTYIFLGNILVAYNQIISKAE